MDSSKAKSFFSISPDLICTNKLILHNLFVNSSSLAEKEKFVKVFPKGDFLNESVLEELKRKYHQLYVAEEERQLYLNGILTTQNLSTFKKAEVLKDSAIQYLSKIFSPTKEFTTPFLSQSLSDCKEVVGHMVSVLREKNILEIQDLIGNLSFHDFYTYDHSINVSMYSIALLKAIKPKVPDQELILMGLGGLLHDLGKIKIPTEIINKPTGLSEEEFNQIQKHPDFGRELLAGQGHQCGGVDLTILSRIIHEHHENFNGTGYPQKLLGAKIHFYARCVAVADFFDAITTKRAYNEILTIDEAILVMAKSVGKKLDPAIFKVFTEVVKKFPKEGLNTGELPSNFDPCQPFHELPIVRPQQELEPMDYGKIVIKSGKNSTKLF